MQINWGLEEGSRLAHYLKTRGLSFPDDMEDLIIRCWYRHLSNQALDDQKLIENYLIKRKSDYAKKLSKIKIDTIANKSIRNWLSGSYKIIYLKTFDETAKFKYEFAAEGPLKKNPSS